MKTRVLVRGPRKGKLKRGTKAYREKAAEHNEALRILDSEIMSGLNQIEVELAAIITLRKMRKDVQEKLDNL